MAEITQVSEGAAGGEERRDRVPELIALCSFIGVVVFCVGLVLIEFRVPEVVTKAAPWVLALAVGAHIRWGVPSSHLKPARRAQRDERRAGAIVGVLSGCAVLGAITAATYLTSWSQWVVLGGLVSLTVGIGMMLHVRFSIGA